jgi:disulfide bond formation protein DsbB
LQHLPEDQVPACGPSLGYMLETLPIAETFKTLMMGDGNCAEVQWTFLSFSMPEWSLAWFLLFGIIAVSLVVTAKNRPTSAAISQ